ncbi:MAG: phosphoribosylanthranilate isomerase [Gammaproteobacteria bacterium]|nr:phosphoribosylanthranilate isomerase [Gammaproteobacteria bacterium]
MSIFIKICGLQDASDVAAAAAAGVNAVGFVFAESVRKVTPEEARAATRDIPAGIKRVAVLHHPSNDECKAVLDIFAPDVVQTDAGDYAALEIPENVERWPVIREGMAPVEAELPAVFLYEGTQSGSGETVDWSRAARIAGRGNMILAGGLAEDNVAEALRIVRPYGVDVSSGVESLPGCKDHEKMRRFVSAVRAAERKL